MSERPLFHLAFPVNDLAEARYFYGELLECPEGRSSDQWVDFNFYGHQIVAHVTDEAASIASSRVDGDNVPVRHFGVVLRMNEWRAIAQRLKRRAQNSLLNPMSDSWDGRVSRRHCLCLIRVAMRWNSRRSATRIDYSKNEMRCEVVVCVV